jgi:hypothetical protein
MSSRQPTRAIAFSDEQLRTLRNYARPLLPAARGRFLQRVARLLEGESELAEGVVARACRQAQGESPGAAGGDGDRRHEVRAARDPGSQCEYVSDVSERECV